MVAIHSTVAIEQRCLQHIWAGVNDHSFLNKTS